MRHSLHDILMATLTVFNIPPKEWKENKKRRFQKISNVKDVVSQIGADLGYTYLQIAHFLHLNRSTVYYHTEKSREFYFHYREHKHVVDMVRSLLGNPVEESMTIKGWLARAKNGALVISAHKMEKMGTFWVSEGCRILKAPERFPQITYETSPAPIIITIKIDKNEKM